MQRESVHPDTSISLIDLSINHIVVQICQPNKIRGNIYRIQLCQNSDNLKRVQSIFSKYSKRKLYLNSNNIDVAAQFFSFFPVNEIILNESVLEERSSIPHGFQASKYKITAEITLHKAINIYQELILTSQKLQVKFLHVQFTLSQLNSQSILSFILQWLKANATCTTIYKKLDILEKGQRSISLENKPTYGIFVCVNRKCDEDDFCFQVLCALKECELYFSCQFMEWDPSEIKPVQFVFHHLSQAQYLVKFGNSLEITHQRILINTKGMTVDEVSKFFELMELPGHYQLICYSQKLFLSFVIKLFMHKPLILFQFYPPLQENKELMQAIGAMVRYTNQLRHRIQIFQRMLKSQKLQLQTILNLYWHMCKRKQKDEISMMGDMCNKNMSQSSQDKQI